ncbi:MAG: sulfatase [Planctomycetes bacterium]|nr:sulfatase [Planctomycetota bacterium]
MRLATCGIGVGSAAGALLAGFDLFVNRVTVCAAEASQMVLFLAAVAAALAVPVVVLPGVVCRLFRRLPEPLVIALVLGVTLQVAFAETLAGRDGYVSVALTWLAALGFYRRYTAERGRGLLTEGLAVAGVTAALVPLALAARQFAGASAAGIVILAVGGGVCLGMAYAARRRAAAALAGIAVVLLGVQWLGAYAPQWRVASRPRGAATSETLPGASQPAGSVAPPPNVVLIVLDTTRADYLGCYGHGGGLTPRLDAFAAEGALYAQAISPASWTVPSHASLFTGLYTATHGCDTHPHRWLDDGFLTVAEMLRGLNYRTVGLVANEYLAASNLLQGIDEYVKLDMQSAHRRAHLYNWTMKAGVPGKWADQGSAEGVAALEHWLRHREPAAQPFFLFVNLMEAHWPVMPPYAWRRACLPPGAGYVHATRVSNRFYGIHWFAGKKHSEQEAEIIRRLYAGDVAYQDGRLGAMLETLRAHTDLDNTVVIITADHGENLGEGGRWDHVFAANEALIRVPLIIRFPPRIPKGTRLDGQCQLTDVVPTVFDLIGRPCPAEGLPGRSLAPDVFRPHAHTFAEVYPYYGHLERMEAFTGFQRDTGAFLTHLRAVRTEQYKYIWSSNGPSRLFDIARDPREEHDVTDQMPAIATELHAAMEAWWLTLPPYEPRPGEPSAPIDDASLKSLKSLGYVGDH